MPLLKGSKGMDFLQMTLLSNTLRTKKYTSKSNVTPQNQTRHLVIAYPQSIQLAQTNQDVVLIDNIYKTNKFDMPLLYIIGKQGFCRTTIELSIYRHYKLRNDVLNWILLPPWRNATRLYIGVPVLSRAWNQAYSYSYRR
jgi:hypothetical protein